VPDPILVTGAAGGSQGPQTPNNSPSARSRVFRFVPSATLSHRSLHSSSKDERTVPTACSQSGPDNGLQRPIDLVGQTRAQFIMARRDYLHARPNIFAQTCVFSAKLPLAYWLTYGLISHLSDCFSIVGSHAG
jgi:hypothetical protein